MAEEFVDDIISGMSSTEKDVSTQVSEKSSSTESIKDTPKDEPVIEDKVSKDDQSSNHDDTKKADVDQTANQNLSVEELAAQLGWNAKHEGPDAVDAVTYILRSKDIQKSMSRHNRDLKDQLNNVQGSIDALKKHNERVYQAEVKRLQGEITKLKAERREAIELADVAKVEEIDQQIEGLQKDIEEPKEEKTNDVVTVNPVYDEWIKDNEWYLEDDEMAQYADTVAQNYVGAPLERIYSLVRTRVQEVFPEKFVSSSQVASPKQEQIKNPIGPKSPVEGGVKKSSSGGTFTKADLTPDQLQIMKQFVQSKIMTEEQYINDIAKMQ